MKAIFVHWTPDLREGTGTLQILDGVCSTGYINQNDADGAIPISIRQRAALAQ